MQGGLPDVEQLVCLPGRLPAAPTAPPHAADVGIIVLPRQTLEVTEAAPELDCVLGSAPAARRLLTTNRDGAVTLRNLGGGEPRIPLAVKGVTAAAFSPDGRWFLTYAPVAPVGQPSTRAMWNARTGARVKDLGRTMDLPVFSPNGRWILSTHKKGLRLRTAGDGATVRNLPGATSWNCLAFGPHDASLLVANGNMAHLWCLADGCPGDDALAKKPNKPDKTPFVGPFSAVAYSEEGSCVAVAAQDGRVRIWQLRPDPITTLAVRREVELPQNSHAPADSLLLDPAGTRLVTWRTDRTAALWSARTGARLADLSSAGGVRLLAFSHDGRWLATVHDDDNAVNVWDASDGHNVDKLTGDDPVALAFTPDCSKLAVVTNSQAEEYAVRVWKLRRNAPTGFSAREIQISRPPEIKRSSPPIIHTSGRWLAYVNERLAHVWDIARSTDITTIYAECDDPAVPSDHWDLEPAKSIPPQPCGVQVAATKLIALTAARHLQLTIPPSGSPGAKRTVQLWDAEHVYEADDLLAKRQLVTTRTEVAGPTYADVTVTVDVVRRSPSSDPARLEKDIRVKLSRFFDPRHGGPEWAGWPFGHAVYASEICQVVEAVDGVDHVERVRLNSGSVVDTEQLDILPCSLVKCKIDVQVRS